MINENTKKALAIRDLRNFLIFESSVPLLTLSGVSEIEESWVTVFSANKFKLYEYKEL